MIISDDIGEYPSCLCLKCSIRRIHRPVCNFSTTLVDFFAKHKLSSHCAVSMVPTDECIIAFLAFSYNSWQTQNDFQNSRPITLYQQVSFWPYMRGLNTALNIMTLILYHYDFRLASLKIMRRLIEKSTIQDNIYVCFPVIRSYYESV